MGDRDVVLYSTSWYSVKSVSNCVSVIQYYSQDFILFITIRQLVKGVVNT